MPYSAGRMLASKIAYSARNSAGRIYPSLVWNLWELYREMPRTLQHTFPRTPVKPAVTGKDGNCLLCGLNLKLSGQNTWQARSLNSGDLKGKVCRLLERTPDFQRESTRLCKKFKKCFRRIESLIKRSKDYEEEKRGLTECHERKNPKARMFVFVEKVIAYLQSL